MKSIVKVLALSAVITGFAQFAQAQSLNYYTIRTCDMWTPITASNGFSGYMCSNYPMTIQVPDANSLVVVGNELTRKIQALELRVQELEKKIKN